MTRRSLNGASESCTRRDPGFWSLGLIPVSIDSVVACASPRAPVLGRGGSRRSLAGSFLRRRVSERAAATEGSLAGAGGIREHREHPVLARAAPRPVRS